jgi:hypothetical protein
MISFLVPFITPPPHTRPSVASWNFSAEDHWIASVSHMQRQSSSTRCTSSRWCRSLPGFCSFVLFLTHLWLFPPHHSVLSLLLLPFLCWPFPLRTRRRGRFPTNASIETPPAWIVFSLCHVAISRKKSWRFGLGFRQVWGRQWYSQTRRRVGQRDCTSTSHILRFPFLCKWVLEWKKRMFKF